MTFLDLQRFDCMIMNCLMNCIETSQVYTIILICVAKMNARIYMLVRHESE